MRRKDNLLMLQQAMRTVTTWLQIFKPQLLKRTISVASCFLHRATAPTFPGPHYRDFTITLRHNTLGRNPLDDWKARRRDLYLTTHSAHKRKIFISLAEFEPTIPACERPHALALDRAATAISSTILLCFTIWIRSPRSGMLIGYFTLIGLVAFKCSPVCTEHVQEFKKLRFRGNCITRVHIWFKIVTTLSHVSRDVTMTVGVSRCVWIRFLALCASRGHTY
jgi:hypothetical protein